MSNVETESELDTEPTDKINKNTLTIGLNRKLSIRDVKQFSTTSTLVNLSPESFPAIQHSYQFLKSCVENHMPIYGVNTHFGDQVCFIDKFLNTEETKYYYDSINNRQENLIKSHTCGLGALVSSEIVKVTMLLRLHCLSQGYSGVSQSTVESMLKFVNSGIVPKVHRYGSIGASGDLIPLATIAASMLGENTNVEYLGRNMMASQAIKMAKLIPIRPQLRDGLAMINGTSFMTAISSLSLYNFKRLFKQMLISIAMSLESMLVIASAYHPLVHQLKLHKGERIINNFFLNFWQGSKLIIDLDNLRSEISINKKNVTKPLQDYYSMRAVPQGFGTLQENLEQATIWIENEINSVNDNPIVDVENKKVYQAANFMGYYITDACDFLKNNIAQASTWIHALLANMIHPRKNHGLPANLVKNPGKDNGFRPIQLLTAALTVQNRKLAQSQQAYMIPTEGDNQDVNSLGTHAALDFQEAVANLERLTAILLLASVQALELRGIENASEQSQRVYRIIRSKSSTLEDCRPMTNDIESIIKILHDEII